MNLARRPDRQAFNYNKWSRWLARAIRSLRRGRISETEYNRRADKYSLAYQSLYPDENPS